VSAILTKRMCKYICLILNVVQDRRISLYSSLDGNGTKLVNADEVNLLIDNTDLPERKTHGG
jgi:hypothetical protein